MGSMSNSGSFTRTSSLSLPQSTHDSGSITKSFIDLPQSTCSGSLTLYSKTYLRGEEVVITEDTETQQFTDKLVSLSVTGDCCWEVFTGVNYTGDSEQFTSSEKYLSTTSVGQVFRNAKSVKKC